MRLYVSSDMEGIAGVCSWQQVDARTPHPDYAIFRRFYTQEVASAIAGARAAGATEVLVNDSHGPMRNLLLDELPDDDLFYVMPIAALAHVETWWNPNSR